MLGSGLLAQLTCLPAPAMLNLHSACCTIKDNLQDTLSNLMCWKNFFCPALYQSYLWYSMVLIHLFPGAIHENTQDKDSFGRAGEDYLQSGQLKPWFCLSPSWGKWCCVCTAPWSSSEDHLQQYCDSTQDLLFERARVQLVILMIPLDF